ncbi:MAG: FRG domain-containing protein [Prevotella sp.]|nr:FRG domain-containing protein [Prevotella sp.]
MKQIITRYEDIESLSFEIARLRLQGWKFFFRGHASLNFQLLSMAGRKMPIDGDRLVNERLCFQEYLKLIKGEDWLDFKLRRENEKLFLMSIGRHLGLNCRLLDWTAALDTALYFATSEEKYEGEDGQLWIMAYDGDFITSSEGVNPFSVKELTLIKEDYYIPDDKLIEDQPLGILRRFRQNGYFTITPSNQITIPLNKLGTETIRFSPIKIHAGAKREILKMVTKDENWLCLSKHYKIEDDIYDVNLRYFR